MRAGRLRADARGLRGEGGDGHGWERGAEGACRGARRGAGSGWWIWRARWGRGTPLLKLPEGFGADTPPIEIHPISRYDERGPYWAWNWLKLGEHSGTHFDAPQHWVSGKDYSDGTTDRIDPQHFVGPVCVIDCSAQVARDPDFLLTADGIRAWEAEHGRNRAPESGS